MTIWFNTATLVASAVNASTSSYATTASGLGGNVIVVANTTNATTTNTGALQVYGGIGIGGNLYVGGNLFTTGTIYQGAWTVSTASNVLASPYSGIFTSTNTTNATTTNTGALQVAGGVGIGGNLYVGGPISGLGNSKLDFTTYGANAAYLTTTDDDSTALFMGVVSVDLYAQTNINIRTNTVGTAKTWIFDSDGDLTAPGKILVQSTASSTSTTTGALQVQGGAGIGGNLYVGGNLFTTGTIYQGAWTVSTASNVLASPYSGIFTSTNTTNATTTNTGALQVAGGVGIGGNLYVGGIVTATTFVGSANLGTTSTTAAALGYLGMPQLSTASSYTLVAGDQGKHIYITATAQTITIPANAAVAFPIGTTISLIAGPSATSTTIGITTDTMYLGGTGTTGNRTLAAYGMATLVKVSATVWYINGVGLT